MAPSVSDSYRMQSAGQYYTLTGLRVAADTKGLLITGGKKIIIK